MDDPTDRKWMQRALDLATRGEGSTSPNPMVGAVLVRDGQCVGQGWHGQAGADHAEVIALREAGDAARGACCYVTLEPCAHYGRTPPCVHALIAAGVTRVVTALEDPDDRVQGRGHQLLLGARIDVVSGVCEAEARALNEAFLIHRQRGRPRVTIKAAASLDGKVAAADGTSQWLTGESARADAHRLRAQADAVIVGAGTALHDNPRLTVRLPGYDKRQPLRVLLDGRGRVGARAALFNGGAPTLVCTTPKAPAGVRDAWRRAGAEVAVLDVGEDNLLDVEAVLSLLAGRGVLGALVEGGPAVHASFWRSGMVDRLVWYLAPTLLGAGAPGLLGGAGVSTLADAWRVRITAVECLGDDLKVSAVPKAREPSQAASPAGRQGTVIDDEEHAHRARAWGGEEACSPAL